MISLREPLSIGTVVRPSIPFRPLTVVVVGAFRGGTSLIGERLDQLGVPMGRPFCDVIPNPDYVSYEDRELGKAIDDKDWQRFADLAAGRNAVPLWGFKKPSSSFHIDKILPMLRNPHIVAITRDPLAAHQSGMIHGTVKPGDLSLETCRSHFLSVLDVIMRPRAPTLAFSFERAKDDPVGVDACLRDFLGLTS